MEIAFVLALLVVAVVLYSRESIPIDVTALLILGLLLVSGTITPSEAFAGFGSDTVIMIAGLFVLTGALIKTGIMDSVARTFSRLAGKNDHRLAMLIMITVACLSAFISNTAATAVFLPLVISVAARSGISQAKLLMPLAFASILTSSVTIISTSTNIVVSGLLPKYGMPQMGMFELAPVGIPIAVVGLLYMFTLGIKLLPDRTGAATLESQYKLRDYLSELIVMPDSPLIGKTLAESNLGSRMDLVTVGILRNGNQILAPRRQEKIQLGDLLLVEGRAEDILKVKAEAGIEIKADVKLPPLESKDVQLVEAMVMPGSDLRGQTLKRSRFREELGLTVLAINRRGVTMRSKLSVIPLKLGDVLLLQGNPEQLERATNAGHFTILGQLSTLTPGSPRAIYAFIIFALTITAVTFRLLPLASAVVIGCVLMLLIRALTPEEAYNSVEWRIVVLIGCMIAFGTAMQKSGTASFLATGMIRYAGHLGPRSVLAIFFLLTVALTQPMSNQAAALVVLPVAIETARQMHLNARTFAMMIAVAASCSYLTPLEPSCVLVYGPGRYKFADFFRVGIVLTILIFAVAMFLVPTVWPF